jgi:hypothetical protein
MAILNGDFGEGDVIEVDRDGDKTVMRFTKTEAPVPAAVS